MAVSFVAMKQTNSQPNCIHYPYIQSSSESRALFERTPLLYIAKKILVICSELSQPCMVWAQPFL